MDKRETRQVALHLIFEMQFKKDQNYKDIYATRMEEKLFSSLGLEEEIDFYNKKLTKPQKEYIEECVKGVSLNIVEIDEIIALYSKGWNINRISKVSLAILRLAIFEIKYLEDIPEAVSINEAVDIAKMYEGEESEDMSSFINGILGSFVRANG